MSTIYEIQKLPESPDERPLIIAQTSKKSAQRLIAALAEREALERYRCITFEHPELPFGPEP